MKLSFIILFFIVFSRTSFGQSFATEFYKTIDKANTINDLERSGNKFKLLKDREENLNFGIVHTTWHIDKKRKSHLNYLLTLAIDGRIFYREFYECKITDNDDGIWEFDKLHTYVDSTVLQNIRNKNAVFDMDHVERYPNQSSFGYACGGGASMPYEGRKMLQLVNMKDTTQLIHWLMGINPVKQVYSYLGLKFLHTTKAVELTGNTLTLMTNLENNPTLIYSCEACTYQGDRAVKSWLTPEQVKRFVDNEKKYR